MDSSPAGHLAWAQGLDHHPLQLEVDPPLGLGPSFLRLHHAHWLDCCDYEHCVAPMLHPDPEPRTCRTSLAPQHQMRRQRQARPRQRSQPHSTCPARWAHPHHQPRPPQQRLQPHHPPPQPQALDLPGGRPSRCLPPRRSSLHLWRASSGSLPEPCLAQPTWLRHLFSPGNQSRHTNRTQMRSRSRSCKAVGHRQQRRLHARRRATRPAHSTTIAVVQWYLTTRAILVTRL